MSQPFPADHTEQPLTPDNAGDNRPVGITLTTLSTFQPSTFSVVGNGFSGPPSFGILSTFPPTPCGLATFSAALADGLTANGADVSVVRVSDGPPSESTRVIGELVNGSPTSVAACAELLNQSDVAVIQHEYGI